MGTGGGTCCRRSSNDPRTGSASARPRRHWASASTRCGAGSATAGSLRAARSAALPARRRAGQPPARAGPRRPLLGPQPPAGHRPRRAPRRRHGPDRHGLRPVPDRVADVARGRRRPRHQAGRPGRRADQVDDGGRGETIALSAQTAGSGFALGESAPKANALRESFGAVVWRACRPPASPTASPRASWSSSTCRRSRATRRRWRRTCCRSCPDARDAGDTCVLAGATARGDRPLVLLAGHLDTVPAQGNLPGRLEDGDRPRARRRAT